MQLDYKKISNKDLLLALSTALSWVSGVVGEVTKPMCWCFAKNTAIFKVAFECALDFLEFSLFLEERHLIRAVFFIQDSQIYGFDIPP